VAIGRALEPLERKAARERQGARTDLQPSENFSESSGEALSKVAAAVGMSRPTYKKAAEIVRCVEAVDKRQQRDKQTGQFKSATPIGATAKQTAKTVGISSRQVSRVRTIIDHAIPETQAMPGTGEAVSTSYSLSSGQAYSLWSLRMSVKASVVRTLLRSTSPGFGTRSKGLAKYANLTKFPSCSPYL
jgi:hypothetical protein